MSSPDAGSQSGNIAGARIVPLRSFSDSRGYFFESFRREWIPEMRDVVQGNVSFSKTGVLRGMHYHLRQADFWLVPSGLVRAALYDLRLSSPTRGNRQVIMLGEGHPFGVYIPKGVAHGFCALADSMMTYLVDEYYDNTDERGIRWNDPAMGIEWGVSDVILSERDARNPLLSEIPAPELPG